MHDGLKAYDGYTCNQALCNEHHHRELNAVLENDKQPWAQQVIDLLYEIKRRKDELIQAGCEAMDQEERAVFEDRYRMIVKIGLAENPPPPPPTEKKRGRVKQSKTKNLLDRLNTYRDAALAYMHDFHVPFTSRIRGFVSTLRKQNLPILNMLRQVFEGKSVISESATTSN